MQQYFYAVSCQIHQYIVGIIHHVDLKNVCNSFGVTLTQINETDDIIAQLMAKERQRAKELGMMHKYT